MQERRIGSYRITGVLGQGGMGVVYRAEHALLGRQAAIKVLKPEYSRKKQIVDRFFNEARAAAAIKHPGIIQIFDFGYEASGEAYIAMELLTGETLGERLQRMGRLDQASALRIAIQVANILTEAHEHDIVHRDLKPDNIFLVRDPQVMGGERVKILDFGVAKMALPDGAGPKMTRPNMTLGTPKYMAPEQCRSAAQVDGRADLYSLGCILFAMLCGQPPFVGTSVMEVMGAHIQQQPPRPRTLAPDISAEMESLLLCLLAKDPDHRYQSAGQLEAALYWLAPGLRPNIPETPRPIGPPAPVAPTPRAGQPGSESMDTGQGASPRRWVFPLILLAIVLASIGIVALVVAVRGADHDSGARGAVGWRGLDAAAPMDAHRSPIEFATTRASWDVEPGAGRHVVWAIETRPAGAQVVHDGQARGQTPLFARLARDPGRTERLSLELADHVAQTVELSAADDQNLDIELVPHVRIEIRSRPEGAALYSAATGEEMGRTPGVITIAPGSRAVELILRKDGYHDHPLTITPDRDQELNAILKEKEE